MKAIEKLIGKKVIIRSYGAGVFFGTLNEVENAGDKLTVEILDARRLWCWEGACSLSQLATEGTKKPYGCKFSVYVPQQIISSVMEIIPTTQKASESINNVEAWKK